MGFGGIQASPYRLREHALLKHRDIISSGAESLVSTGSALGLLHFIPNCIFEASTHGIFLKEGEPNVEPKTF